MNSKGIDYRDPALFLPRDAWDSLSLEDKAAMMDVAVRNGITNLADIRKKYNEFAEGGSIVDNDLVIRVESEEGFNKKPEDIGDGKITLGSGLTAQKWHDLYRKRGNKWSQADNRMAVTEELRSRERWARNNIPNWERLPDSSKKALLSYKYNYDFNQNNSPKLFKALSDFNLPEVARQMDATSKDPKFKKGLQERRKREQQWFMSDVATFNPAEELDRRIIEPAVSTAVYNPYVIEEQNIQMLPVMAPDEDRYVTTHVVTPTQQKAQKLKEAFEARSNFNRLMDAISFENTRKPEYKPKNAPYMVRGLGGPLVEYAVNQFAGGGDKNPKPVTTGGAGYVPPAPDPEVLAKKVRNRMYRTINPFTDYNIRKNLGEFIAGQTIDYGDVQRDKDGKLYIDYEDGIGDVGIADELWANYLQIPENERRFDTRLKTSKYRPQMGGESDTTYYKLPLTDSEKEYLIEETESLPIGRNKVSDILSGYNLADHTIGRGFDSRGEYRSYYDRWDINPFNGKYQGTNIPFLNSLPDASFGIGKPVAVYDRIYLDDYYGVPEPTHATYLPEVTVYSSRAKTPYQELLSEMEASRKKKHAKGGSLDYPIVQFGEGGGIHIKHPGRLTALKKRTGKTEAELYNDGNPAHKKMVVFARNARKWKHGYGGPLIDYVLDNM